MTLRLVPVAPRKAGILRRLIAGLMLVAAGYIAAILAPMLVGLPGGASLGIAATPASASAAESVIKAVQCEATTASRPRYDFDYFPDRYQNQATEVAEPIATF